MNLNPLATVIHQVIEDKGFHDIEHSQVEVITFRQLLHLVTEWAEMFYQYEQMQLPGHDSGRLARLHEEGADILIVALDLAGMHRLDLRDVRLEKVMYGAIPDLYMSVPITIGLLGDTYRKQRVLDRERLIILIWTVSELLRRHGASALEEVQKKMEMNKGRPRRYGTAEVES
jgi:NTP pyrophosphatase (non-canonical NTP hydrolase)